MMAAARPADAASARRTRRRGSRRPTPSSTSPAWSSALSAFLNTDLSAFYFDIRKDALYCEPPSSLKRLGALEAIERIFRAVTVWLAPILVFTAEEAWRARYPTARSVHLELFPEIPEDFRDPELAAQWETLRKLRSVVTGALEIARAAKEIGSSLEAHPVLYLEDESVARGARGRRFRRSLHRLRPDDRDRPGAGRRVPPRRRAGRGGGRAAGGGRQMRALLALFRSRDRRSRISRRDAARRQGAARMARAPA